MATSTVLLAVLLALVLGALAGFLWGRAGSGSADALKEKNAQLTADLAASLQAEKHLNARVQSLETKAEADADVLLALAPLKTQLATMERSVRTMESERAHQYGGLAQAIAESNRTQAQLRDLTGTLSTALRSTSARGTWGEAQLKRVVEAAGMAPHVTYSEQTSAGFEDAHGAVRGVRPDMVINLPGGKTIILDAKAPLGAYLDAQESEGPAQKADLDRHAKAVRAHVDALASKQYWAAFDATPELVLCFIPAESALAAALAHDGQLLDYAATKNIALVAPVSLLAALKAIAFSWRQESLTDNARELFVLSQQLYERLGTAGSHLGAMGRSLTRAVDSYNGLVGSLETRVFVTARKIAELNKAPVQESLFPSPNESAVKPLTSPEFLGTASETGTTADSGSRSDHPASETTADNTGHDPSTPGLDTPDPESYDSWLDDFLTVQEPEPNEDADWSR